jgi:hypothetical protein
MAANKKPTHNVFVVEPGKNPEDQGFWHQIGVAWENENGVLNVKRFAQSLNGEEVILPADYKKA